MDKQLAAALLEKMMLSRKFEENVQYYFSLGMIHGTTHLGIGEEATTTGTCLALKKEDDMFATHRGHGAAIAKGIDLSSMMAEMFGKVTGVCKGRGGSMHIADRDVGVLGANGATNEGIFHEALNLASVWGLPVLFVCTNNQYGMSTHISKVMKDTDITHRAIPYAMKSMSVDGNDAEAVYNTVREARSYVRARSEPVLIVENTYRISGHSKSDGNLYRTKEEIQYWKQLDPIELHRKKVLERGLLTEAEIGEIDASTTEMIERAVKYAIESPYPKVEDIYEDVYAD